MGSGGGLLQSGDYGGLRHLRARAGAGAPHGVGDVAGARQGPEFIGNTVFFF